MFNLDTLMTSVWRFLGVQGQPNKKLEKKQKKMVVRSNVIVDAI